AGRSARLHGEDLPIEGDDARENIIDPAIDAGVRDRELRLEEVGTVEDDVIARDEIECIGLESAGDRLDLDLRKPLGERARGALRFWRSYVLFAIQDL